jgi:hypothetical protein
VMAKFMNQHVGHDFSERVIRLSPVIEDRPAVKPDHIGKLPGCGRCSRLRPAAPAKQAQKVEFARAVHGVERFIVGKILDADHDSFAKLPELSRESSEGRFRYLFEVGKRRRGQVVSLWFARSQERDFSMHSLLRRLSRT